MALPDRMAELPHILVVDDDDRIRQLVARYLREQGFVACEASDAAAAREMLKVLAFDALVVDVMMPGESGLDFTSDFRTRSDVPVLLLTALGESKDRIAGLETGADDYLPKPFEPRELVLRLNAILRRRPPQKDAPKAMRIGRWIYDPAHNELRGEDETLRLTTAEATLLAGLAGRAGEVVTREALAVICGLDAEQGRTIDVQVTRLRRKIEDDPKAPRWLQTVRGKGYLLRAGDA